MASKPIAFISSTKSDLELYRLAAQEAALNAGFAVEMMEYFPARGDMPPYHVCMERVEAAEVIIAIVAYRYGWVPGDQPPPRRKSITWLECEWARSQSKEVLAFVVDERYPWPSDQREGYVLTEIEQEIKGLQSLTPQQKQELLLERTRAASAEVNRRAEGLADFKKALSDWGVVRTFTTPERLRGDVLAALAEWRSRHPELHSGHIYRNNPAQYFTWVRDESSWIDIRGLQVGAGKAHRFPITDLYIPLKMATSERARPTALLEEALKHQKLVIVGDPGSGKTTFLRRIALELAGVADQNALNLPVQGTPLLIRISELREHVESCRRQAVHGAPTTLESPAWLVHLLGRKSEEWHWELSSQWFEAEMDRGRAVIMLDGLDEAPSQTEREWMARLFENATQRFRGCHFIATTRPGSYVGRGTLADFKEVWIDDLDNGAIRHFLGQWAHSLFPGDDRRAGRHLQELMQALQAKVEIRRMARNPVMLTALAVVHWNERRLPEQRADLYESIVTWLARSREQRLGRAPADRCLALLGSLALFMQSRAEGRLTQVSKRVAAETLAPYFRQVPEQERLNRAQRFLDEEEVDSGIVVSRGAELRFWHLTFQEYLAARTVAGLSERAQEKVLLESGTLYRPEWRELMVLLSGTLLVKQGAEKVDGLFERILDRLGPTPTLAQMARCVGLLGAMLRDLRSLAYEPADLRYQQMLELAMTVFDDRKSRDLDLRVRLDAAETVGEAGDPRLRLPEDSDYWVTLPACNCILGAQARSPDLPNFDPEARDDEGTHEVATCSLQIGKFPVTVEEFRRFVWDNGYENERWWEPAAFRCNSEPEDWEEQLRHPNRPVVGVTWYEASAYCCWAGVRLPTEQEWERAARGGTSRRFAWGDESPNVRLANYDETGIRHPSPVGLFPRGATQDQIYDLCGNVWEWLGGFHDALRGTRPVRGGAWILGSWHLRAAHRDGAGPRESSRYIGFRCLRDLAD